MVGVGYADVGGGVGRDIGDNVVVYLAVVVVKAKIDLDVRIKLFKILNRLFINGYLCLVGIVFCPLGDLVFFCFVKLCRKVRVVFRNVHLHFALLFLWHYFSVAGCKRQKKYSTKKC